VNDLTEQKNRVDMIIEQVVTLKNYLADNPDQPEKQVLEDLNLKKTNLYRLLLSLANDPLICVDGKFPVLVKSGRLSLAAVREYLDGINDNKLEGPKPAERLLYLYHVLHNSLPYGGVTMKEIKNSYQQLIESSCGRLPSESALRRMIYRDLADLEGIGIAIDRPSTGSKYYCLRGRYLPKLSPESAGAIYISMLLNQDTLMEKAISYAKQELEKAFFTNLPDRMRIISERIYVIGDKLTHPEEFGDTLGKLVAAVVESYKVRITYVKLNGQTSQRFIYPLGIVSKRSVWYVIAWAPSRNDYRTFRIDQVLEVIPYRDSTFPYPDGFSVAEFIGSSWGVFCDDPVQLVRLRFSPGVANRIKKLSYHPSQKIVAEDKLGLIVEYEVCGFNII